MDTESDGFTRFYETARDDCLRAVFASGRHPAPQAWVVRTALNARVSRWRRRRRE